MLLLGGRDACSSVHSFTKRLFSSDTLARCSAEDRERWQAAVPPVAPLIVRRLMAGLLGFLPHSVTDQIPDVIFAVLRVGISLTLVYLCSSPQPKLRSACGPARAAPVENAAGEWCDGAWALCLSRGEVSEPEAHACTGAGS